MSSWTPVPAYYAESVSNFLHTPTSELVQQLTRAYEADRYKELMTAQFTAWREEIDSLKHAVESEDLASFDVHNWGIAMEFVIPRRMGRIDAVILAGDAVLALEFKTQTIDSSAADQIEDYCLDLLYFHETSHNRTIYPIVVGRTGNPTSERKSSPFRQLEPTKFVDVSELGQLIASVAARHRTGSQIPVHIWNSGQYRPVPTIVEAAIGMFAEMEVDDIAKADCDPINLTATVTTIRKLALESMQAKRKTVCFVTGVPGAGKTLAGLQVVHDRDLREISKSDSVFLTGNLPLVKVLRCALSRDAARRKKQGLRVSSRDPKTTIDTVLGYKRTHTRSDAPPHERIVVFDEAQRAWNAARTAEYLDESESFKGHSEPELMMTILDRHDWALLVALVGGGQEINKGEAGIGEWGKALESHFKHWHIAVPQQALDGDYGAGAKLFASGVPRDLDLTICRDLHLDNPTRQFRGKTVARWAEALLRGDCDECQKVLQQNPDYPVYLTRNLDAAKRWLKDISKGSERYGCISSSEAKRIRADGLELPPARADGVEHWFLAQKGDVRSSFQLEIAANEFQIQGLEIDWACVCWGGDFVWNNSEWRLSRFRGTVWQRIGQPDARAYLTNSYRVLLTRARQGMVFFVPPGDDSDITRLSAPFDATANFLSRCGAKSLPDSEDNELSNHSTGFALE